MTEPTVPASNPNAPDPSKPIVAKKGARTQFLSMVLVLEAFVTLFGTIVAAKFVQVGHLNLSQTQVWTMCAVLMVLLIVASRMQKSPLGIYFGAVLQIPFLMTGRYMDMMYLVAVVFIAIWVASLWLGTKIDRERAAYDAAHPETAPNA